MTARRGIGWKASWRSISRGWRSRRGKRWGGCGSSCPGATELVYDNYNALVVGFCVGERPSSGIFSIAVYPRYVTLFFLKGVGLPDPNGLLGSSGNVVRRLRLESAETLDRPEVRELIAAELARQGVFPEAGAPGRLIIQSVSPNRRPRRPAVK